jgi:hypothetical protein
MGLFVLLSLRGIGLDGTRTPLVKPTPKPASQPGSTASDEKA